MTVPVCPNLAIPVPSNIVLVLQSITILFPCRTQRHHLCPGTHHHSLPCHTGTLLTAVVVVAALGAFEADKAEAEAEEPNRRPTSPGVGPGREVHPRSGGVGTSPGVVDVTRDCLLWETCVVVEAGAEAAIDLDSEEVEEVGQLHSKS